MSGDLGALKERISDLVDQQSDVFEYGGETDAWGDIDHGAPDFSGLKASILVEIDRFVAGKQEGHRAP